MVACRNSVPLHRGLFCADLLLIYTGKERTAEPGMEGEARFLLTKTKSRIGILSLIECLSLINCASVDQINNSHAETKHSCRVQSGPGEIQSRTHPASPPE